MNFDFLKGSMIIYKLQLSLLSPRAFKMIDSMRKVMVAVSMYPASRIVVKTIKRVYISI